MQQSAVFSYLKADVCNKNIISCQHNLTPAYYNILTLHLSTTSCCVELTISEWRGVIHVLLHSCIIILTLKWETDFLNTNRLIKIFKDMCNLCRQLSFFHYFHLWRHWSPCLVKDFLLPAKRKWSIWTEIKMSWMMLNLNCIDHIRWSYS